MCVQAEKDDLVWPTPLFQLVPDQEPWRLQLLASMLDSAIAAGSLKPLCVVLPSQCAIMYTFISRRGVSVARRLCVQPAEERVC